MMKKFLFTLSIVTLFLTFTNAFCQDVTYAFEENNSSETTFNSNNTSNTILENGTYSYKLGSKEVIVSIKNGYYTETYANNEFIKAKIDWLTENQYTLTIVDLNKENLPFKEGTKLTTKITKVKGNQYFYKSDLIDTHKASWTGKFKKITNI
ncbi:hypothetical protein [Polaribacter sp. KT 15]|uniref:hypothetical protein n=1 Tax=Polaribacter sp. KT 15 TaxID=1896175 RepID=UPI00090B2079|nr:hypothetical protein [Polaribacter sp. KT 15]SHM88220.1 hypothetical protein SAMN05720268_1163 [Polaribacter sp. KT 15]